MSYILEIIAEGLEEIFPDAAELKITPDMELGAIPDWDSMSSVNFQVFIEQHFEVEIPQELLTEETTIDEVILYIKEPEKMETIA